jgi:hypothetical protein
MTMAQVNPRYNVTWTSPSKSSLGSMPLSGRHGAGANVWVQDGSIWLYLAHNAAYDEEGRLLKLGCLRITPHNIHLGDRGFSQTLDLATGAINIRQASFGVSLRFIDQTLIISGQSKSPDTYTVAYASWRYQPLKDIKVEMNNVKGNYSADHIESTPDGFLWYHNNALVHNDIYAQALAQGIDVKDVGRYTEKRIFGGAAVVQGGLANLKSEPVRWQYWDGKAFSGDTHSSKNLNIAVCLGSAISAQPAQWKAHAVTMLRPAVLAKAEKAEKQLWNTFWARAHVNVNLTRDDKDNGFLIGRNYQLFRYMLACNRGGEFPLLFNGGIFTFDNKPGEITGNNNNELPVALDGPTTPDFRRWMTCHFMSQNERWLGWPTLANGDEEMRMPTLHFYRDRSDIAAARAQKNGAQGVVYTEPLDVWGLCCVGPLPNGLCGVQHLTYHFSMMLENAWMALVGHSYSGASLDKDLNWIIGTVRFYDTYYRLMHKQRTGSELNEQGKLVIYPGNGLELAGDATNPLEAVCGLHRITDALISLPQLPDTTRAYLKRVRASLPDMPMGVREGKQSLIPAQSWKIEYNKWEPIEMYAAWPYRMIGVTRPGTLQLARDTWETVPADRARLCKQDYSWMANLVNMAALALPEEARKRAIYKMANTTAPQARFPAFFGPGHDWIPDHNWGCSGMTGIQEMLMAANPYADGKIYLLPAWPKDWDVAFKLHAPQNTTVDCVYKNGKITRLVVTPASRKADIVYPKQ